MSREKMINRQMLVPMIKAICLAHYKEFTVTDFINKGGQRNRVEIEADGASFYMDFHFKANGSTSIDTSSGLHADKKKLIRDAILSDRTCLLNNDKN